MRSGLNRLSLNRRLRVAFTTLVLMVPGSASATFVGQEILYEFLLPYPSTPLESATFSVGSGPDFVTGLAAGQAVLDFGASTILIGPFQAVHSDIVALIFLDSGFRFSDFSGGLADIASVSISPMTTVSGITPDRLEFTADSVQLDLSGLSAGFGEVIRLEAVFVPEPATALLTAAGLVVLSLRRHGRFPRRRALHRAPRARLAP